MDVLKLWIPSTEPFHSTCFKTHGPFIGREIFLFIFTKSSPCFNTWMFFCLFCCVLTVMSLSLRTSTWLSKRSWLTYFSYFSNTLSQLLTNQALLDPLMKPKCFRFPYLKFMIPCLAWMLCPPPCLCKSFSSFLEFQCKVSRLFSETFRVAPPSSPLLSSKH